MLRVTTFVALCRARIAHNGLGPATGAWQGQAPVGHVVQSRTPRARYLSGPWSMDPLSTVRSSTARLSTGRSAMALLS